MSAALPTRQVAKPWGRETLPAPFTAPDGERIGEIWFEPPAALPQLLVKYLFTSDKLSVQVHPDDDQAEAAGLGRHGKEECWLVVDAEPGAVLGIGFREPLSADTMRTAALDGSIEGLLEWHPVSAGNFFYIPAGTVHAIGAGISLIEIQQSSDITYRLFDYGRPRELHLEAAVAVAKGAPLDPACRRMIANSGSQQLVDGPLFRLDLLEGMPGAEIAKRYAGGALLAIPMEGALAIGGEAVAPGQCALAGALDRLTAAPASRYLIAQPCA